MEKRKKTIKPAALILAAVVLVAVIAAGFFYFRSRVERGPASALENALSQWAEEWKSGDSRALSEGMIFAASPQEKPEIDEAEDGALSAEELKAIMEERYSDLIEPTEEAEPASSLFPILMRYTTVSYTLPSNVERGQIVTFEITGPDMEKILPLLDESADQAALLSQLEALLKTGNYAERTVTAQSEIEALDNGYRLRTSYELINGLYGGLPGIVSDALPGAG